MRTTLKILVGALISIGFLGCGGGSASNQDESATSQHVLDANSKANKPSPSPIQNQQVLSAWRLLQTEVPESVASAKTMNVTGYRGTTALNVHYTFNCQNLCSGYLALGQDVSASNTIKVARIRMKSNPALTIGLRVHDVEGQVIQYFPGVRSLEGSEVDDWHLVTFDLTKASLHWNGANDGKIHGGVKAIEVLVTPVDYLSPVPKQLIGDVVLDQLELLENANSIVAISDTLLANIKPAPKTAEVFGERLGVAHEVILGTRELDRARVAGFSFIRTDIYWEEVEKEVGQYRFGDYDVFMANLAERRMGALVILDYGHPKHNVLTPEGRAAFIRYAKAVATRYRWFKNIKFEIWNEPDVNAQNPQWHDKPAKFSEFCREVSAAIHEVDPNFLVTSGATSWFNMKYLSSMFNQVGDAGNLNAIGVHAYRSQAPETLAHSIGDMRGLMLRNLGKIYPLWMTEWGYSLDWFKKAGRDIGDASSGRFKHLQALYNLRQVITQWALDVPMIVHYALVDRGNNLQSSEDNYGLIDSYRQPKPTFHVLSRFIRYTNDYIFKGMLQDLPVGLHAMVLESKALANNKKTRVLLIWQSELNGSTTLSIPSGKFSNAVDMYGNTVPNYLDRGAYMLNVSEWNGPIYLTLK